MNSLQERIAQFRKMATEDPENELGHFRLGQLLLEDGQLAEAVESFRTTLKLSPQFSKVYQLLGETLLKLNRRDEALEVLTRGWSVADERGDKLPRDAMGVLLTQNGGTIPKVEAKADGADGPETGFRCQRPGCPFGKRAKPLTTPPVSDAIGARIVQEICSGCWDSWKKDYSIKVINELRLDLSSEFGSREYDKHMRGYFGFEESSE